MAVTAAFAAQGTAQTPTADRARALDDALRTATPPAVQSAATPPAALPGGGTAPRLIDISLSVMAAAGTSTERGETLRLLQAGGHDPKRRGFTFEQAELAMGGAIDPYLTGRMNLVALLDPDTGETAVELEEAYLLTQDLPYGLQVKAGTFLTEFGRINPRHPHAWDWIDQPVIHSRVFGGDGMRGPGARVSWLAPTARYLEATLGLQNANGETMPSFLANEEVYEERPLGGRAFTASETRSLGDFVWTGRLATGFDLGADHSVALGISGAFGPNATGDGASTTIYGADFVWKWQPPGAERGYPFFKVEAEVLGRDFETAAQVDTSVPSTPVDVPATTLHDFGGFVQGTWGFASGWAVGLRAEMASGSGQSYDPGNQTFDTASDPWRAERFRIAPILTYKPSEFSRIRLQYDYDDGDALADPVHTVWLGFEFLIGTHPPHAY